ncbi:unnamed protein product [Closterium sp. NIES-54]
MVHQVLQRFGFTYSSPQSTPPPTGHSLSAPPSDESVEPSGLYPELVGCLMYLMTCTRPDLAYPLSLFARYVVPGRHQKVHWDAAKRVLRYLCNTSGMGLVLVGRARVVLTGHADASWVDDLATQRSSQGYTFSLGSGSVSWRSTRSSSVLSSCCEAEIYAGAMAAQELRWLTYLLTDLGEAPRSPPVLYVDNKAMLALCQEHRLEHRQAHCSALLPCSRLTPQSFRQTPPPTFPRQIRVLNHLPSAQVHKRAVSRRLVARSGVQSASNGEADRGDDSREPFQSGGGDGGAGGESGSSESEARRLALDDAARAEMRVRSELALAAMAEGSRGAAAAAGDAPGNAAGDTGGSGGSGDGGAWKWAVRKGVWDELEARDVARPPRPVHHRIPNFDGADKAAAMLASLPEFQAAGCVKVNPDTPQKAVRLAALQANKLLLTPQPRLRTGFFSRLSADHIPPDQLLAACTAAGVARHGVPVALEDKVGVDMVVLGSVAVDPTTGARLGKGEVREGEREMFCLMNCSRCCLNHCPMHCTMHGSMRVGVDIVVLGSVAVDPSTGARLGKGEVREVEQVTFCLMNCSICCLNHCHTALLWSPPPALTTPNHVLLPPLNHTLSVLSIHASIPDFPELRRVGVWHSEVDGGGH